MLETLNFSLRLKLVGEVLGQFKVEPSLTSGIKSVPYAVIVKFDVLSFLKFRSL